jgi:hypothetical protein
MANPKHPVPAPNKHPDQDRGKGAVEQDEQNDGGNTSMQGQLGHRDQDEMLKSSDTDYPEPDGAAEHSGEPRGTKRKRPDQSR